MKNKKTVYILLPVVAIIWGVIFFKIFTGLGSDDSENLSIKDEPIATTTDTVSTDYALFLDYSDPFLKTTQATVDPQKKNHSFQAIVHGNNPAAPIPDLRYMGMIQNTRKKEKVALLSISNVSHMLKPGESRDNVTVVKIWSDSVQLRFGTKTMYLKSGARHDAM